LYQHYILVNQPLSMQKGAGPTGKKNQSISPAFVKIIPVCWAYQLSDHCPVHITHSHLLHPTLAPSRLCAQ